LKNRTFVMTLFIVFESLKTYVFSP